jgi:hypothetical protein
VSHGRAIQLRVAVVLAALTAVIGLAACGSSDSTSSTGASGASGASGESGEQTTAENITTTYAKPAGNQSDQFGAQLLKAVDVGNLSNVLATTFEIPKPLAVKAVNGIDGGPNFNPANDTITFQYGFAALIYQTLAKANPDASKKELGYATGATLGFVLEHEFTHALISMYDLPVLGKEEDAADTLATLLLLKSPEGARLALSAAEFWADFAGNPNQPPSLAAYADEHSLDLQRSYSIVCDIAGSSETNYKLIQQAQILPEAQQIKKCPAQYQQDVDSFTQVLEPHLKGGVDLQAPSK